MGRAAVQPICIARNFRPLLTDVIDISGEKHGAERKNGDGMTIHLAGVSRVLAGISIVKVLQFWAFFQSRPIFGTNMD